MPQSLINVNIHYIFSTRDRIPSIDLDLAPRLYSYLGGIARAEGACLLAAGGMPDHVHLLVSLGKTTSIADMVRLINTNSSKWIHEDIPDKGDFAWQAGYGAFSVSFSQLKNVKRYIRDQAEHHRVRTFQDEFCDFMRRHEIEYDERYVWD